MSNAGSILEEYLHDQATKKPFFSIKDKNGKEVIIGKDVKDIQTGGVGGTKCKFDVKVGKEGAPPYFAMQVKSGSGHSATVFGARLEAVVKCGVDQHFDSLPVQNVYDMVKQAKGKVKLSDNFELSEWSDLLYYFLYMGTAGSEEISSMQANKLVYLSKKGELTIFDRTEGVEFLWSKLFAEVRYKSGQEIIAVRVMN